MKRIILTAILALAALTASAQTLVVYYSKPGETYTPDGIINLKKGNTQEVAERIQKIAKADIFRVETVKTYSQVGQTGKKVVSSMSMKRFIDSQQPQLDLGEDEKGI